VAGPSAAPGAALWFSCIVFLRSDGAACVGQ
jgi:hypothetical protein